MPRLLLPARLAPALLLLIGSAAAQLPPGYTVTPQTPLSPKAIPAYTQPLPVLDITPEPLWASYPKLATVLPEEAAEGITLKMCEFKSPILPPTFVPPAGGTYTGTWTWGYAKGDCPAPGTRDSYLGPVVVSLRNSPTPIHFVNALPATPEESNVIAYRDSVDQTLHWADPDGLMCDMAAAMGMPPPEECFWPFRKTGIPAVPHLHGGMIPPQLDGGPDQWFTSDGAKHGPTYYTSAPTAPNATIFRYPNNQEAAPLWFHDHTLGATRLNVFAGLAGAYYLVDPDQQIPDSLKDLSQVVPLALQDRMFDTTGELFYTSNTKGGIQWALNPEHPYWTPEFIGDTIVVNGKAWPYLQVEPKRYRFLVLNGSNARTYELFLVNRDTKVMGPSIYVIGTDGGYLDSAVQIDPNAAKPALNKLLLMPGERYEIVVDFSGLPVGTRLWLKNTAKSPYPGGATPTDGLGHLMEFRVTCAPGQPSCTTPNVGLAYDPAATPQIRATPFPKLVNFTTGTSNVTYDHVRRLTLNEVMGMGGTAISPVTGQLVTYPGGPLEILVNNTKWSGMSARNDPSQPAAYKGDFAKVGDTWYSELPKEGDTELWEIVNLTADAHPIHLHLSQFQILNRQNFDATKYQAYYASLFPPVNDPDGNPLMVGMYTCTGGVFCPGYGPPLDYFTGTPGAWGGNPDPAPYLKDGIKLPTAQEVGWKDTIMAPPGMVTRIVVRWAPMDEAIDTPRADLYYPFDPNAEFQFGYVWHCHIIDHEDNEMMRPDLIQLNTLAPEPSERPVLQGRDY